MRTEYAGEKTYVYMVCVSLVKQTSARGDGSKLRRVVAYGSERSVGNKGVIVHRHRRALAKF